MSKKVKQMLAGIISISTAAASIVPTTAFAAVPVSSTSDFFANYNVTSATSAAAIGVTYSETTESGYSKYANVNVTTDAGLQVVYTTGSAITVDATTVDLTPNDDGTKSVDFTIENDGELEKVLLVQIQHDDGSVSEVISYDIVFTKSADVVETSDVEFKYNGDIYTTGSTVELGEVLYNSEFTMPSVTATLADGTDATDIATVITFDSAVVDAVSTDIPGDYTIVYSVTENEAVYSLTFALTVAPALPTPGDGDLAVDGGIVIGGDDDDSADITIGLTGDGFDEEEFEEWAEALSTSGTIEVTISLTSPSVDNKVINVVLVAGIDYYFSNTSTFSLDANDAGIVFTEAGLAKIVSVTDSAIGEDDDYTATITELVLVVEGYEAVTVEAEIEIDASLLPTDSIIWVSEVGPSVVEGSISLSSDSFGSSDNETDVVEWFGSISGAYATNEYPAEGETALDITLTFVRNDDGSITVSGLNGLEEGVYKITLTSLSYSPYSELTVTVGSPEIPEVVIEAAPVFEAVTIDEGGNVVVELVSEDVVFRVTSGRDLSAAVL